MRLYQIQVQKCLQVIRYSVIGLYVPKMGTNLDKNYEDIIISKGPIHFPKPIGFIHHTLLFWTSPQKEYQFRS